MTFSEFYDAEEAAKKLAEAETIKNITRAYRDAREVQHASNMTGVIFSLEKHIPAVQADCWGFQAKTAYQSSNNSLFRFHPVPVLFNSKLHDMSWLGISDSRLYGLADDFAKRVGDTLIVGTDDYYAELAAYFTAFKGNYIG